jgi:hypothetical protein
MHAEPRPHAGNSAWKRSFSLFRNLMRVYAFRSTVSMGYYTLNATEVALTVVYLTALAFWSLVNSSSDSLVSMRFC